MGDGSQGPAGRHQTFAPLRHPRFRALWLATLASNTGAWIQGVAAAWAMVRMAPGAELVALVQTATSLPVPLLSLLGGTLADQWGRRPVYLAGQALMMLGASALALAAALDALTVWSLLGLVFLTGCGTALRQPAAHASAGDLVPPAELPAAIALNSMSFNAARAVGPAIGGVLVAGAGVPATLLAGAALSAPAVAVLLFWAQRRAAESLPREGLARAMLGGFRYVAGERGLLAVLLRCLAFTMLAASIWALLPVIARDIVGGGPVTYGTMLAGIGVGAVAGGFAVSRLRQRLGSEGMAAAGGLAFAVACCVPALTGELALIVPALMLGGAAWMATLSSLNVLIQVHAAGWVRGRVIAIFLIAWFGGLGLGSWAWGQLADLAGIRPALALAGAGMLAAPFLRRLAALPAFDGSDHRPLPRAEPPCTAAGPGRVILCRPFRIAPADTGDFRRAMAALRRIRRRDGCGGWQLLQNLAVPGCWTECVTYASPADYERQRRRPTRADGDIFARADSFHRGPPIPAFLALAPPVRRWERSRAASGEH
ncbi:MFS transporter [Oleomonas cavernae]|uniref:MFS transporter n=1 Tax=Oleomonas cavernae TaxID=2320859 RepID=A0A418W8L9_9PROT|nr:MFS transporter [Oleomonas cavernae]RJF86353.1 MFS transporter [Oleomonas cavernae]